MGEKIKLTDAELDILSVLWSQNGATVRDVFEALGEERKTTYTTFLKLMQIMHEKKLVERDERGKSHIYYSTLDRLEIGKNLISDIIQKVFGGSATELVEQVLELQVASPKDMKKIRKKIKQSAKEEKSKKNK